MKSMSTVGIIWLDSAGKLTDCFIGQDRGYLAHVFSMAGHTRGDILDSKCLTSNVSLVCSPPY